MDHDEYRFRNPTQPQDRPFRSKTDDELRWLAEHFRKMQASRAAAGHAPTAPYCLASIELQHRRREEATQ